jgi:hypothetical protein
MGQTADDRGEIVKPRRLFRSVLVSTIVIFGCLLGMGAHGQGLTGSDGHCPLSDGSAQASIERTELEGSVGQPILIDLKVSPYPPPSGFFYTSVVDVTQKPDGPSPNIIPGDRQINVRCYAPGIYRLRVRINLIAKSSCGGAKAAIIKEESVQIAVAR